MNNEIEKVEEGGVSLERLKAIAKELASSRLFPSVSSPAEVFAVIEYGRELGIPPVMALQSISVVKGRLCPTGQLMLAIARRNGVKWQVEHEDEQECRIRFSRDDMTYVSVFTIDEAKRAGLIKEDSNWAKYPRDMLFWRAVARGLRRIAPDLMLGGYLPEELEGEVIDVEVKGETQEEQSESLQEPSLEKHEEEKREEEKLGEEKEGFGQSDLRKMRTWLALVSTPEALEEWRREWEDRVKGTQYEEEFRKAYETKKKQFEKQESVEALTKEDLLAELEKLESVQEAADWLRKRKKALDKLKNGDRLEVFKRYQDRLRSLK